MLSLPGCCLLISQEDGLESLDELIACNVSGRTVHFLGKDNLRDMLESAQYCPFSWQGHFKGHVGECIIILEVVTSQDLCIWHSFFSMTGSHNDIKVFQHSPMFSRLAEGNSLVVQMEINAHQYNKGYHLADGIYPKCSTSSRQFVIQKEKK